MTLIEAVIYVAFLGGIAVFLGNFLIQISNAYARARAEREIVSNGRLLIQTIAETVSSAAQVYDPTSRFNVDSGQLSVISRASPPPPHSSSYIDFWVDAGQLLMKREGQQVSILSSPHVTITVFRVEKIAQGLGRESAKITIGLQHVNTRFSASTTLFMTTALRGNY